MYYKYCPCCGSTHFKAYGDSFHCLDCDFEWDRDDFFWNGDSYEYKDCRQSADCQCYCCGSWDVDVLHTPQFGYWRLCNHCGATF